MSLITLDAHSYNGIYVLVADTHVPRNPELRPSTSKYDAMD